MRIGIDARYLSHGLAGGVHTYVGELLRALIRIGDAGAFVLYADAKRPFELEGLPPEVAVRRLPWRGGLSTVANDFALAAAMSRDRIDVAHFPANYGRGPSTAATVVTLHDTLNLLPLRQTLWSRGSPQSLRSRALSAYLRWWTWRAVARADLIVTVSEFSRREIVRTAGVAADRFVLADALKNPDAVIRAWQQLPEEARRGRRILFFARHRELFPSVFDAVAAGVAQLIVRPSHHQLAALYSMADAFVFPSWMEGFGLPVVEAMAYGAPVVCSTRGALPEVVGDAARLVDPHDVEGLSRELAALLMEERAATRLRDLGFARARQFTWEQTARHVLDCYGRARALKPR
jgi:glycosyltransferase involved in cell wall biosynthesis